MPPPTASSCGPVRRVSSGGSRPTWPSTARVGCRTSTTNTRRVGETTSGFKVLVAEDTDRVLGAHLLGPHADEVINIFAVAIRLGIPAAELKDVLFAYPTYGSDVRFML